MALNRITTNSITVTGVTAGSYGDASNIPALSVDVDGRVTAIVNTAVSIPSGAYVVNSNNSILTTNTVITSNVTIAPNTGGLTIGPVVIEPTGNVIVSANARWVVL
jgi:hypothetical protein